MSTNQKPNVVLQLVASFNYRGNAGETSVDQEKLNTHYEPITNLSGETTLYLSKRPGVTDSGSTFGTAGQVTYLVAPKPAATSSVATQQWVFSVSGNDIRASSSAVTTVIATAAGYVPVYVDRTAISAAETLVLQLRNAALAQTVWYSTAIGTFTQISDADFTGLNIIGKMEFMDGWAFVITTNDRIYNSNINSLANWTSGQFLTKQVRQDQSRGLARFNQQILAFGAESMEVFRNAGKDGGSPLEAVSSGFQKIGIPVQSGPIGHYYAILDNRMFFFGQPTDSSNGVGIYTYNGGAVEKVSTVAIDKELQMKAATLYGIWPVTFFGQKAIAVMTDSPATQFPNVWLFFLDHKEWFKWASVVFLPINGAGWFAGNSHASAALGHKLHSFTSDQWTDAGTSYDFGHKFKFPSKGTPNQTMHFAGVTGDTQSSGDLLIRIYDTDNSVASPQNHTIDLTSKRKTVHRLGMFQDRTIQLYKGSGTTPIRLKTFFARVD